MRVFEQIKIQTVSAAHFLSCTRPITQYGPRTAAKAWMPAPSVILVLPIGIGPSQVLDQPCQFASCR